MKRKEVGQLPAHDALDKVVQLRQCNGRVDIEVPPDHRAVSTRTTLIRQTGG
ncbi:MAG: hypothetical protein WCS87_12565 [Methylococcaceae bacterium]